MKPVILLLVLLLVACGSAPSKLTCTHDDAIAMGAKLHEKLDFGSERWRNSYELSEEEKDQQNAVLIELMDATTLALRGEDEEACRRYRKIAAEQDIDL